VATVYIVAPCACVHARVCTRTSRDWRSSSRILAAYYHHCRVLGSARSPSNVPRHCARPRPSSFYLFPLGWQILPLNGVAMEKRARGGKGAFETPERTQTIAFACPPSILNRVRRACVCVSWRICILIHVHTCARARARARAHTHTHTHTRARARVRRLSLANELRRFLNSKEFGHLRPRIRSSAFLLIFASESCLRFLRDPISTRKKRISFTGHVGTNDAIGRCC